MRTWFLLLATATVACVGNSATVAPETTGGPPLTPIHEVQGADGVSPLTDQSVVVSGVVSGDFQRNDGDAQNDLGGFFLQQEPSDGNPATSDGVFVYDDATSSTDVSVGDVVRVAGTVLEFHGETQIAAQSVDITGSGSINAVDMQLPAPTMNNSDGQLIAELERFEGMLVRVPGTLTVTGLYDLERYGELRLSHGGRIMHFTNTHDPDVAAYSAHRNASAARSLILDDGSSRRNVAPIRYLVPDPIGAPGRSVRVGDQIHELTGHIRFSRGSGDFGRQAYRLVPSGNPHFVAANQRPATSPVTGGALKIASFNVLNFFSTLDTGRNICGPAADGSCRGADSEQEFARQLDKIVSALGMLDADIVGLMELENDDGASLQIIVEALNRATGAARWTYLDTGPIGTDAIRVGVIYRPLLVSPHGSFAILDGATDARFNDHKNRPVLAQSFRQNANDAVFTVAIGHLKSKGSPCDDVSDPDVGDGQADCNLTRASAVAALLDWLATDPTNSQDADFLVIGDMNAYLHEDPVSAFEAAGYASLLREFAALSPYSFVLFGESGALDHAFASPTLRPQVSTVLEWHINADEPPVLDYNLDFGRDPALFDATTPYRSSDHDPIVIGLNPAGR